ncbi:MAG: prolyl oligopeptidase family serine peptidase [Bacillota bacterium]
MAKPFVAEDLFRMDLVGTPRLSPKGDRCAFVVTRLLDKDNSYTSALWLYDGSVRQITNLGNKPGVRDGSPRWSPDGNSLAFLSNRSGKSQVWMMDLRGGEAFQVTDLPKGVTDFRFDPKGGALFLSAKEDKAEPKFREGATARRITKLRYKFNGVGYLDNLPVQVWKMNLETRKVEMLTSAPYNCGTPEPSPDGRYVVFAGTRSDNETDRYSDLWLLDVETKNLRKLTRSLGEARNPVWSKDGRHVYYLGHEKGVYPGGYPEIRRVDVESLERSVIACSFPYLVGGGIGADVRADAGDTGLMLSSDGKSLLFAAVNGGSSYLYSVEIESGQPTLVFGEGQMVVSSYDASGEAIVVNRATPASIGDLFMKTSGHEWKQVTHFNEELFRDRYTGWPERVTFSHPDGTTLEGWVIKPMGFKEGGKYPLVMEIHGGPHTTYGNVFFHEFQILAGHGFGVLYTNPRGSMGYGEEFARSIVGDWCGLDARDLEFMAEEALKMLPWADPERYGVTGGSQGGYFTNWLISHTLLFAAAVTQRSMSNLYSKYGVADNGWSGDRAGMGGKDLWDDEDFIMERSPIRYARNVRTPTLIIHSDMDFRCPLEQGEQWYVALKRLGVEVEMLLFHGENHELSRSGKPANRVVRLEGILDWFARHLKA